MNLETAIRELHLELERVKHLIAALEEFERTGRLPQPRHQGRKSMGDQERGIVSQRMRKYWAGRREED